MDWPVVLIIFWAWSLWVAYDIGRARGQINAMCATREIYSKMLDDHTRSRSRTA